ncbi:hypothetical protein BJ170DRAFT_682840 [Xylariales sp. AK1849]|nr:hypothetical protein BJ170DRAFT_682840 [Xylariales sp. AK1849]
MTGYTALVSGNTDGCDSSQEYWKRVLSVHLPKKFYEAAPIVEEIVTKMVPFDQVCNIQAYRGLTKDLDLIFAKGTANDLKLVDVMTNINIPDPYLLEAIRVNGHATIAIMSAPTLDSLPRELQVAIFRLLDPIALICISQSCAQFRAVVNPSRKHFVERLLAAECLEEFGGPIILFLPRNNM